MELLERIQSEVAKPQIYVKDTLAHETEKMYVFNALGICLEKLKGSDGKKYKDGISRTKIFFQKVKNIEF